MILELIVIKATLKPTYSVTDGVVTGYGITPNEAIFDYAVQNEIIGWDKKMKKIVDEEE